MTREQLGGLVGRSYDWVKEIEGGERQLHSLPLIVAVARALGATDVNQIVGGDVSMPVSDAGKMSHPGVVNLRAAVHGPLFAGADDASEDVGELAGRVRQAWQTWHLSRHQRTDVARVLPGLLTAATATARHAESADRSRAYVVLSEAYALAQQYAAHTTEPELYWIILDRARTAAEQSDDPVALAAAAWIVGNGLRVAGHTDEALRIVLNAAESLRPQLEDGDEKLRATFGSLCLHASVTFAQEGREGDAWRWHGEAERTAARMPHYTHPWTAFGVGNVAVHGVTIGVDLRTPGAALQQLDSVDPGSIPSTERRSRLFLDAARGQYSRKETAGAVHYLRQAYDTSPEAVRYVPSGRSLALELARNARGALQHSAVKLAEDIGVAA